ncbi:MAG TPA: hypothetical protein VGU43_03005, partial [Thermoplasmata archaeon]|nr:hypothetical protein [Thermoplasmata archaeon]
MARAPADGHETVAVPPADGRSLELLLPKGALPLGYGTEAGTIYLIARERSAQWPIELLRAQEARVRWPGGEAAGPVELVSEPSERDRIFSIFRSKYGEDGFRRWYEHPARVLRVRAGAPASSGSTDRYYAWLRTEFDNIADDY